MKRSLPIVANKNTKILIVGTAPGEESLEKQEYYTNKSNRFWKIIFKCLNVTDPIDYNKRTKILLDNSIGLWDVYESFEREGSADKNLRNATLNDFSNLNPSIKIIISNGKKPMEIIKKEISKGHAVLLYCFSTSSTNVAVPQEQILNDWKNSLNLAKKI